MLIGVLRVLLSAGLLWIAFRSGVANLFFVARGLGLFSMVNLTGAARTSSRSGCVSSSSLEDAHDEELDCSKGHCIISVILTIFFKYYIGHVKPGWERSLVSTWNYPSLDWCTRRKMLVKVLWGENGAKGDTIPSSAFAYRS